MNNSKTIAAKKTHFPVVSCLAVTIHKSQGGTFDEIVYEYEKSHSQQLLYVALSRVTTINGLYIVTPDNNHKFHHGRKPSTSGTDLQAEFRRLRLNRLETIGQQLVKFMSQRKGISIFTFNCQSLSKHAADLRDDVVRKSSILVLSETWMQSSEPVDVPNFDCVVSFKRAERRAGGVAIYRNSMNRSILVTPHILINVRQMDSMTLGMSSIGVICSARLRFENGQFILIVAIYISPNQKIDDIIEFIHHELLSYTPAGAALLKKDWGTLPMILSGDFNIDFAKPQAQFLIHFLHKEFSLKLTSDRNIPTTRFGTTIDAVFSRFLENINSQTFISYFSYHKPIVSVVELEETMDSDT